MSSRPRLAAAALALTLVLAALALTACGGKDASSRDAQATALIKDTFAADHPIRSGRVDAALDVNLQGFARMTEPLSLRLSGPFQSNGGKSLPDFSLDLDVQGTKPVTVGAVFAQGGGYLTVEGQAFDLGKDVTNAFRQGYLNAKADAEKKGQTSGLSLSALGIRPERWLRDPRVEGSEDIAGQQTQHVTAKVDVDRLLQDVSTLLSKARSVASSTGTTAASGVPTQITPQQREEIARSVKDATIDVWTGKSDHTLRKLAVDIAIDVPEDLRAKAGGLRTGHVSLQVTLAELNQPQKIAKPASPRPISELRAALAQLGLVSGSSASGASGSAASSAAPSASPQADYAQCLAKAGEDLAQVQKCAALLK